MKGFTIFTNIPYGDRSKEFVKNLDYLYKRYIKII